MNKKVISAIIVVLLSLSYLPLTQQTGAVTIKGTTKGDTVVQMTFPQSGGTNSSVQIKVPSNAYVVNASLVVNGSSVQKNGTLLYDTPTDYANGTGQNITISNSGIHLNSSNGQWTSMDRWQGALLYNTSLNGITAMLSKQNDPLQFATPQRIGNIILFNDSPQYAFLADKLGLLHLAFNTDYSHIEYMTSSDNGTTWVHRATLGGAEFVLDPFFRLDPWNKVHIFFIQFAGLGGSFPTAHMVISDGGKTLTSLSTIQGNPVDVAWGPDGTMNIVSNSRGDGPDSLYMDYLYSKDNGLTLSGGGQVNDDGNVNPKADPTIAVDSHNEVYIMWSQWNESHHSMDLVLTTSKDHIHFTPTRLMEQLVWVDHWQSKLLVDSKDKVHLLWTDNRAGNYDVYYTGSTDAGATWSDTITVNSNHTGDQTELSALLGYDDTLRVTWTDENNTGDIYYTFSNDSGLHFNKSLVLNDARASAQNMSMISQDPFGNLYVSWRDGRNAGVQSLYYTRTNTDFLPQGTITGTTDLGIVPASLDHLLINADVLARTQVTAKIRTSPDNSTWSAWETVNLKDSSLYSPPARYINWVITLSTADPTISPFVSNQTFDYSTYLTEGWYTSPRIDLVDRVSVLTVNWNASGPAHSIDVTVSLDNGTTWFEVQNGVRLSFTAGNSSLRYHLDLSGLINETPVLSALQFHHTASLWPHDVTITLGPDSAVLYSHPGVSYDNQHVVFTNALRSILNGYAGAPTDLLLDLNFTSSTAGRITVSNILILLDLPLVLNSVAPVDQNVTMNENSSMAFGINATDPDGAVLTYLWTLDQVTIPGLNGPAFIYNTTFKDSGNHKLSVLVSDGRFKIARSWSLKVLDVNRPPKLLTALPLNSSLQTQRANPVTFNVTATDPDGDNLSYYWYVNGTYFGTPLTSPNVFTYDAKAQGTFDVSVVVSDGKLNVTQAWTLKVLKRRPGIIVTSTSPGNTTLETGKTLNCMVTATQLDKLPLNFSWYLNGAKVDGAVASNYFFKPKNAGTYTLEVRINDGYDTVTHDWTLRVKNKKATGLSQTLLQGLVILIILIVVAAVAIALYMRKPPAKDTEEEPPAEEEEEPPKAEGEEPTEQEVD